MNFSANAIVEAISQRLQSSLGAVLHQSVAQFFAAPSADRSSGFAGPRGGRGYQSRRTGAGAFGQSAGNFFSASTSAVDGLLRRMSDIINDLNNSSGQGAGSRKRGSSPADARSAPAGSGGGIVGRLGGMAGGNQSRSQYGGGIVGRLVNRAADWWGQQQISGKNSGQNQPMWMKWVSSKFNKSGIKRMAFSRAARVKALAQRQYKAASAAVKWSKTIRGTEGWHPAKHGQLLAAKRSAAAKLAQATSLQAKATSIGAGASERVAKALAALGISLPWLGKIIGTGVGPMAAMGVLGALKVPGIVAGIGASRINGIRNNGDENGQIAAAMSKFDVMTERLKSRNARDTGDSTNWLVGQQNALRNSLQPMQSAMANATNYVLGGVTRITRQGVDNTQGGIDWVAAIGVLLASGKLPTAANRKELLDEMKQMKEQQMKDDAIAGDRAFTNHADQWVKTLGAKREARQNAKPKRQLPPIR